jgi:alkanesulfonate monooxygenase SsuD/methylene tetrahydromethanopterin reductase-like flavin-dependent oxidoreductase (luciferase family)
MEFGVMFQGYVAQSRQDVDPEAEHHALMDEMELVIEADQVGFKYAWLSEHHFLDEYSHMSESGPLFGYLAHATERIRLSAGIMNPLPLVNHPVKVAERAAMLDHLSGGRFDLGTGRGAGSREVTGFGYADTDMTKAIWDEVVPEIVRMWQTEEYSFEGENFRVPATRNILPKPYKKPHPPLWMACGNPSSYEKCARLGIGALGFFLGSVDTVAPYVARYKELIGQAEPLGAFVNNNVALSTAGVCMEDSNEAFDIMLNDFTFGRFRSLLLRYHDTFPRPDGVPAWPELLPEPSAEQMRHEIDEGFVFCGDPDEVIAQANRYAALGVDQCIIAMPFGASKEQSLATIRNFGKYVIPVLDKDPVASSARFRDAAAPAAAVR